MQITKTALEGVLIIEPKVFADRRGTFSETFSEREFARLVEPQLTVPVRFVQDNQSASRRGVVRGLHFQKEPHAQAKLVRCVTGRILDVAVDMRSGSATYGQHVAVELSAENGCQLFIPRGFAHGFSVLGATNAGTAGANAASSAGATGTGTGTDGTDTADIETIVAYKVDGYYAPECDGGVLWCDPTLGIDWGTEFGFDPVQAIVSEKDSALPLFADAYKF